MELQTLDWLALSLNWLDYVLQMKFDVFASRSID